MFAHLDSTRPVVAFVLAVLVCLVGVACAIWEARLPDASQDDRQLPRPNSGTPQATPRRTR